MPPGSETAGDNQVPNIYFVPEADDSYGPEVIELAESAGLYLDPWQKLALCEGLKLDKDGQWSAFEVALLVSRQSGKGAVLEALELGALFIFPGIKLIVHSAHEYKTSYEHFLRVKALIENTPHLNKRVAQFMVSVNALMVRTTTGRRMRFLTRTGAAGRGLTADLVILDEAYALSDAYLSALMPTMAARPNPQMWYSTSAPDYRIADCTGYASVRKRAMQGEPRIAYLEWSAVIHKASCPPECEAHDRRDDPATWRKANPAYGIRIPEQMFRDLIQSMSRDSFDREMLGIGLYPSLGETHMVIPEEYWHDISVLEGNPRDPVCFGFDVNPERTYGSISVAGVRPDGKIHIDIVDYEPGMSWMPGRLRELTARWRPAGIATGGFGPVVGVLPEVKDLKPFKLNMQERVSAAVGFLDTAMPVDLQGTMRPMADERLMRAVAGCTKEHVGRDGGFFWGRISPEYDISPLTASSYALWLHRRKLGDRPKSDGPRFAVV